MTRTLLGLLAAGAIVLTGATSAFAGNWEFSGGQLRRLPSVQPQQTFIVRGNDTNTLGGLDNGTFAEVAYATQKDDCCQKSGKGKGGSCLDGYLGNVCADVFFAGDSWKTRADDDDNNNFGLRTGINTSVGGFGNIRAQAGISYGVYDFFGREDGNAALEEQEEDQVFVTVGVYQRSNRCNGDNITWGVVWDYMNANSWGEGADHVELSQLRYIVGYALTESDEFGTWGTLPIDDDMTVRLGGGVEVEAVRQYNLYWRRCWCSGGETMAYVGWADDDYDMGDWIIGFNGRVPLSSTVSLFGGVHYIIPSTTPGDDEPAGNNRYAEETWNMTFGFVYTYGGCGGACDPCRPLLPVADNGTFAVAAPEGNL